MSIIGKSVHTFQIGIIMVNLPKDIPKWAHTKRNSFLYVNHKLTQIFISNSLHVSPQDMFSSCTHFIVIIILSRHIPEPSQTLYFGLLIGCLNYSLFIFRWHEIWIRFLTNMLLMGNWQFTWSSRQSMSKYRRLASHIKDWSLCGCICRIGCILPL